MHADLSCDWILHCNWSHSAAEQTARWQTPSSLCGMECATETAIFCSICYRDCLSGSSCTRWVIMWLITAMWLVPFLFITERLVECSFGVTSPRSELVYEAQVYSAISSVVYSGENIAFTCVCCLPIVRLHFTSLIISFWVAQIGGQSFQICKNRSGEIFSTTLASLAKTFLLP